MPIIYEYKVEKMISIIIPVYNVENYLYECINSVLIQSFQDFEIICIDDASTDSSLKILEYFVKKDSRIKLLVNESNKGPGYSRNRGIDIANGKYILFLDGDDWLSFNTLKTLFDEAEKNDLELLMFRAIVYYDEINDFGMEKYYDMEDMLVFSHKVFTHLDLDKTNLFNVPNVVWNKFYLKSFLDDSNIRFTNENYIYEDNPFSLKALFTARRISVISDYLYNRRRRADSIMTLTDEHLLNIFAVVRLIFGIFIENKEVYEYHKERLLYYLFQSILYGKYEIIDDEFKQIFFIEVQNVYKEFIKEYGLYKDIKDNVNPDILDFFKFEDIADEILPSNPEISVIVPVYNVENYLEVCLDSVVNQTFRDIEIICVNDGSTDGSLSILKEYCKHDSRFTIISQENRGLSAARNAGFKVAKGNYIYFLDSDDYIELDALQKLYTHCVEKDLDMLLFKTCCFDDVSKEKFKESYFEMNFLTDLIKGEVFNYKDINQKVYDLAVTMGSTFFRYELISDLTFPEGLIFEDNPFFIEAILNAKRVYFLEEYLYHKRERRNSITVDGSRNFSDIIEIRNIIIDLAKEYDNFYGYLYAKKLGLIKSRYLQTANEFKEEFFNKIKKDFEKHKSEYESSDEFQNLSDNVKSIFYAGLNSKNYREFEDSINS